MSWDPLLLLLYLLDILPVCATLQFSVHETECPRFVDPRIFYHAGAKVSAGVPLRAHQTLPHDFRIAASRIPGAGMGAFTNTFIRSHVWLGEYEGEFLPRNYSCNDLEYTWEITMNQCSAYLVDAHDIRVSNWLRFINCARNIREENVMASPCYGRIYYRTKRDIPPEEELLVYYGHTYAENLGINTTMFYQRDISMGNQCCIA